MDAFTVSEFDLARLCRRRPRRSGTKTSERTPEETKKSNNSAKRDRTL